MSVICIYHGNCYDGMVAAWLVRNRFPDAEMLPFYHGNADIINKMGLIAMAKEASDYDIYIVDCVLPRPMMLMLSQKCNSITVLDHHKTAQADCEGLDFCTFDMNESGASLTWKHFYPDIPMIRLVQYVKDRDIWAKKLEYTEEINAFIQSYEKSWESYDHLSVFLESDNTFQVAQLAGNAINRFKDQRVMDICNLARMQSVAGYRVPVTNSPILMSEVGHELCKRYPNAPFAAYYFDRADGIRQWGARSIGDFDVSDIARGFGGGGHKNAAGWQQPNI